MGPRFRLDVLGEKKKNNSLLISQSKPQFADLPARRLAIAKLVIEVFQNWLLARTLAKTPTINYIAAVIILQIGLCGGQT